MSRADDVLHLLTDQPVRIDALRRKAIGLGMHLELIELINELVQLAESGLVASSNDGWRAISDRETLMGVRGARSMLRALGEKPQTRLDLQLLTGLSARYITQACDQLIAAGVLENAIVSEQEVVRPRGCQPGWSPPSESTPEPATPGRWVIPDSSMMADALEAAAYGSGA